MRVLADLHHGDLYYSLQLLFEKRLGWELYRPIGLDWFTSGVWKIGDPYLDPLDTATQFLGTENKTWDQYKNLNGDFTVEDGIYNVYDPVHNVHQKAMTLEKFKETDIDIVISSYQPHDITFAKLIKDFKPKAKHIAQMGNIYQETDIKNIMCSTMPYETTDKNIVFYHQEFDLDVFKYEKPTSHTIISSLVNILPKRDLFDLYKSILSEFTLKSYGASCEDGTLSSNKEIAELMQISAFGYHVKPQGDGYGHIIHNWFASGRPVITDGRDYEDKLAGELLIDGRTCIDISKTTFNSSINRIRYFSLPDNHQEMCDNAYKRFKDIVDFDEEFEDIKKFLEKVI